MKKFNIHFYENRKIYFGISIAIMVIGLIFNIIFGTNLDIQFTGGAVIKYSYAGEIQQDEVEKIVQDTTKKDVSVDILKDVKAADGKGTTNEVSISFAGTESISVDSQQAIAKARSEKYPNAGFTVV